MSDITEKDREDAKAWLDRKVIHPENTTEELANFIALIRAEASEKAAREEMVLLRPYLHHANDCHFLHAGGACTCGLSAILTPESASEPKLEDHDLYVYDDARPLSKGETR